jgi:hypothetical protein
MSVKPLKISSKPAFLIEGIELAESNPSVKGSALIAATYIIVTTATQDLTTVTTLSLNRHLFPSEQSVTDKKGNIIASRTFSVDGGNIIISDKVGFTPASVVVKNEKASYDTLKLALPEIKVIAPKLYNSVSTLLEQLDRFSSRTQSTPSSRR